MTNKQNTQASILSVNEQPSSRIASILLFVTTWLCICFPTSLFANTHPTPDLKSLTIQANKIATTAKTTLVPKNTKPKIAIIIDDLGHKYKAGIETINLDIPLAVAVLPFTPHGKELATFAYENDQDVMLHLPMQPGAAMHLMTDKTLSIHMMRDDFEQRIHEAIDDIPYVSGLNNHMGSLFTQLPDQMGWLMHAIQSKSNDLFFIDSFTSQFSIAYQVAVENKISTARRDVFLDRQLDTAHMQAQIETIKRTARKQGYAIAIGHPFPETLALLKRSIPELKKDGFEFVKITKLLETDAVRVALKNQINKSTQRVYPPIKQSALTNVQDTENIQDRPQTNL